VKKKTCFGITCVKWRIILKWKLQKKKIGWEGTDWIRVLVHCEKMVVSF